MITIKVVAFLNFFGQGNYCTKNLCAMCTGTKADFSQCIRQEYSYETTNSHKQDAKHSIYYIREYFSRNLISEIFEFRSPYFQQ